MGNRRFIDRERGFTIVELLIVIVVIAILAAITIVAYNGIQDRAKSSSAQTAAAQAVKKIEVYKVQNSDIYPSSASAAGLSSTGSTTYDYIGGGNYYCVTATTSGTSYFQSSTYPSVNRGTCNGLVGWWPLNNDTADFGPNGFNGAATSLSSAIGQNGKSGGAYSFNGTNSQISITNTPELNPSNAITISAWFQPAGPNPAAASQGIISKEVSGSIGNPPYALQYTTSSVLQYGQTSAANNSANINSNTALNTGTWYFGTGVFDGTTEYLYLNGDLQGTATNSDIGATTTVLRIGQQKAGNSRYFNGSIDDVRVYNRALSATEVKQLYLGGAL